MDFSPGWMSNTNLDLAFEVLGCTATAACTETSDAYQPMATEAVHVSSMTRVVQTFTPTGGYAVDTVVLPLYACKANGAVDVTVRVLATDGSGAPTDTVLGTSDLIPNADIADSCSGGDNFEDVTFTFETPVALTEGTVYALELVPAGSTSGGVYWRRSSTPTDPSDPYAGGSIWEKMDFSPGWMSNTNLDLAFEVLGCAGS